MEAIILKIGKVKKLEGDNYLVENWVIDANGNNIADLKPDGKTLFLGYSLNDLIEITKLHKCALN